MAALFSPLLAAQIMAPPGYQQQATDLQTQQQQIDLQKAYAQALMEQSAGQEPQGRMAGQIYIPPSWTQQLNHALKGPLGAYEAQQVIPKQTEVNKSLAQLYANALGGGGQVQPGANSTALAAGAAGVNPPQVPQTDTGDQVPAAMLPPSAGNNIGPTNANAALAAQLQNNGMPAQDTVSQPQNDPYSMRNLLKAKLITELGGDPMGTAFAEQFKATPEMRNASWLGETPEQIKALDLAKRAKEGTQNFQPGQLNILPNGQRIVAPNFETGVAGGFDAQGNPIAKAIQGSNAIAASRAGAISGAEGSVLPGPPLYDDKGNLLPATSRTAAANPNLPTNNFGTPYPVSFGAPGTTATDRAEGTTTDNLGIGNPPAPKVAYPAPPPGQPQLTEAKAKAAANAAQVAAASQPVLAAIDQALELNKQLPSGPFGIGEVRAELGSSHVPLIGNNPQMANAYGAWQQIMGQNILNGIKSLGLGRVDIPIVNALKQANEISLNLSPETRAAKLTQLRNSVSDYVKSAKNVVPGMNQPDALSATKTQPMGGMPKFSTEAEAAAAGLAPGTRVIIGGKTGTWH